MNDLFRKEALENNNFNGFGVITLGSPLGLGAIAIVAIILSSSLLFILTNSSYTRKITAIGIIQSKNGDIKIFAPATGIITKISYSDESFVEKDSPIFTISKEKYTNIPTQRYISDSEEQKLNSFSKQKLLTIESLNNNQERMNQKLDSLISDLALQEESLKIKKNKIILYQQIYIKYSDLEKKGFISNLNLKQKEQDLIDQESNLIEAKRSIQNTKNEIDSLKIEKIQVDIDYKKTKEHDQIDIENSKKDLIQSQIEQQIKVNSTINGEITAIMVNEGQMVESGQLLASIYPKNQVLEGLLYIPSDAIGFIKKNQIVNLRYAAFPYQKFGTYKGTIKSISKVAINSKELKYEVSQNGWYYKVIVNIPHQTIDTYGVKTNLRSGIEIQADIEVDKRKLVEWIFNPLYFT